MLTYCTPTAYKVRCYQCQEIKLNTNILFLSQSERTLVLLARLTAQWHCKVVMAHNGCEFVDSFAANNTSVYRKRPSNLIFGGSATGSVVLLF